MAFRWTSFVDNLLIVVVAVSAINLIVVSGSIDTGVIDESRFNDTDGLRDGELSSPWLDPTSINEVSGTEVFVTCGARASSPVHFEWRKDDVIIQRGDLPEVTITDVDPEPGGRFYRTLYRSILRFYRIEFEHSGLYSCTVYGPSYEKRALPIKVTVDGSGDVHRSPLTAEKKFLIIMIAIVFSFLILGLCLVVYLSYRT